MSWDIVLFHSSEKITSPEELDENKLVPTDFCSVLSGNFKNVRSNDNHRSIEGTDFAIEYFFDDEPATNMMLSLYGEAALFQIIKVARKNNWQIFDTGLGEMLDLENPAKNGYQNFQSYLTQILNNNN